MARDTLAKLCGVLAEGKIPASRLAAALGSVIDDGGGRMPLAVRPHDPAYRQALVVRRWPGDGISQVDLTPADGAVDLAALAAELGPPAGGDGPPTFHHGGCVVSAGVGDGGAITLVTVRVEATGT